MIAVYNMLKYYGICIFDYYFHYHKNLFIFYFIINKNLSKMNYYHLRFIKLIKNIMLLLFLS
jgi:hypothetical protein